LCKYSIKPTGRNTIEGSKVFDLYLSLCEMKCDITDKKIANRVMQGIMSKFLLQMLGTNSMKTKLILFQDVEKSNKGYIYLNRWNEVYDEKFGIIDKAFTDTETQFL
jgi:hypothetical protein